MKKILLSCFLIGFLCSCTSLNTVSLTSIPAKRDRPVKAEASKVIFLGFSFDNDFVDEMVGDLKKQCPNGVVSGVLTKDEVIDYFLFIVWKHRVSATGYCLSGAQASLLGDSSLIGLSSLQNTEGSPQ